ncbi:ATP-binding cassette domain-containing protein [Aquimarina sp. MMG015]|uniref:sulfate/molybdate ABC transporter ATP-binding protein n=1 Tax=unclassified Aquimarina TaxID=2627091 RepID=UPI000E54672C|nr:MULTISPECIES: ATP-binding cassette domain-containing protein [unclassified Aquimarina]AXT56599.1 ATP-binding cassette domain-containing protein [Aquimarina sp. AD1]MBQ4802607.1 ATP-binding cassette domain-containing protein [Aquimarina sp. MMG015]RKN33796.1 ATP-binding cassette domain-containing protein [Aquimarina sp. AD1]
MIEVTIDKKLQTAEGNMKLDIRLSIEKGQLVTLYGASGAGKTSILRVIAGLLSADSGQIVVDGTYWLDDNRKISFSPQQRRIGYVFQDYALFPNMTVQENLEFALGKGQDKSVIEELISIVALDKLKNRKPNTLSGGQQQRVALARALVRKPKVLLLDEPLSALDIKMRSKLQDYILKVHREYELTTILVSHDIGEIIKMSDKVYCLEDGKITKVGDSLSVFTDNQLSGKYQFTGEVINIESEDVVFIVTVLIGNNVVKVIAQESEISSLTIGDKVVVASKAFNPVLIKI